MAQATTTTLGEIKLAGDLAGNNDANAPELIASGVTAGVVTLPKITVNAKGIITNAVAATGADLAALIQDATTIQKGIVKIGDNINIASDSTSGYQIIDIGSGATGTDVTNIGSECPAYPITIEVNGTSQTYDFVDDVLTTVQDVIDAFNAAFTGCVASLTSGDIKITSDLSGGTSSILITEDFVFSKITGYVEILTALDGVADATISVPDCSDSVKGVMQPGIGFSVLNGVVSFDGTALSDATSSSKGIVQPGENISIDSGVISVADATTISKGLVEVGDGLDVTAGVISLTGGAIADATSSTKGIVQIGDNIDVTAGVISVSSALVPDADAGTKGLVQIGDNIDVASGVISIADASGASTKGLVKSADTANISITAGDIDVGANIPKLDEANTYTKAQAVSISTLTSSTSITPDFTLSNVFYVDIAHNFTLNNPTGVVAGGTYNIIIKQDATGSRVITWDTYYKFRGSAPTLSTIASKTDIATMVAQSSTFILTELHKGY